MHVILYKYVYYIVDLHYFTIPLYCRYVAIHTTPTAPIALLLSGTSLSVPYGTNLTPLIHKLTTSGTSTTSSAVAVGSGGSVNSTEPILNKTKASIISR